MTQKLNNTFINMKGIYLTEEGKKEIEAEINQIESIYKTESSFLQGRIVSLRDILASATILPVEESWENIKDMLDINTFPISYKKGVIIESKD